MTSYVQQRKSEFVPSTLQTVNVKGHYYGVPYDTDSGLLFYRTDVIARPPATWQQVYSDAAKHGGIVYQGAPYEGLTCDFLELAFAAGGEVLNDAGTKSTINSAQNLKALEFMVNGVKDGAAPRDVTTYMEEDARQAFQAGRPAFMRNWPYAYALGNTKGSAVKGKFAVAPLPTFEGGGRAGILGGKDYVISAYSKNAKGAVRFIDYATSAAQSTRRAVKFALVPAVTSVYSDPAVKQALPFADQLKQAVTQARVRPVSVVYPQISQAIYTNVNAALSGRMSPQAALKKADGAINHALATF